MRLTAHTGSYVARTVPKKGKKRKPQHPPTVEQPYGRTVSGAEVHRARNRSAAFTDFCFTVADISGIESPENNQQIGGIEGLYHSVGTPWGHQGSNGLATLADLRRPVKLLGIRLCPKRAQQVGGIEVLCLPVKASWGHWDCDRLAALVDLCRPVTSPNARVSPKLDQQSSSIEDLCLSVCRLGEHQGSNRLAALVDLRRPVGALGAMEYAHQMTKRLAALVDLRCSLGPLDVMESRRVGGIEGLRRAVRFPSVPDEIRDFPGP